MKFSTLIKEIKIFRLKPGDILVLKCKRQISPANQQKLMDITRSSLAKVGLDNKVEVLLMDTGLDLQVVRGEKPAAKKGAK